MMSRTKVAVAAAGILTTMLPLSAKAHADEGPTISADRFEHRFIATELPNPVPWGYMVSALADFNGNGRNDIVIVDCDQDGSEAAWLENEGGDPPTFRRHDLPRTAEGTRGSFHSLAVADFNGNGRLDIFTVEQEDVSIFPKGATPRWYIWENMGGDPPQFEERVILDARLGGHDALVADLTGNGKPDIISKVWNPWTRNANNGREHVDLLINRIGD